MSQNELYDKNGNAFSPPYYLQNTLLENYFLKSNTPLEFIDHQYNSPVAGINIIPEIGGAILQRNTEASIKNLALVDQGGASYLQRFNIYKKGATLVWLMRARSSDNTKYIYWRSPNNPSLSGVDTNTIKIDTFETVGSVYEEI